MNFQNLHSNLKIRLVETFFNNVLGNMLFPFLVIYFADRLGRQTAGYWMTMMQAAAIVVGFYGGVWADRIGRRAVMLRAEWGRFASLFLLFLLYALGYDSALFTFLCTAVNSLCFAVSYPANQAMIVDVTTTDNRKWVYSYSYWSTNAALFLGSLIGGYLFDSCRTVLFGGVALGSAVSLVLLKFFIRESLPASTASAYERSPKSKLTGDSGFKQMGVVFRDVRFVSFLAASILFVSIQFQARNFMAVRLAKEMGVVRVVLPMHLHVWLNGVQMYGFLAAENALAVTLGGFLISKRIQKIPELWALVGGILMHSIGFSVLAFSNVPVILLLAMLAASIGELLFVPVRQSRLAELIPRDNRSAYLAVYGSVFRIAAMLGAQSLIISVFLSSLEMAFLFLGMGLMSIAWFYATLYAWPNVQKKLTSPSKSGIL